MIKRISHCAWYYSIHFISFIFSAATGCHIGGRTLRILDFGKVAATFIDTRTEETIRIVPRRAARRLAGD
ncbi:MAG: FmdE family protein [Anaerolineales bacterium]